MDNMGDDMKISFRNILGVEPYVAKLVRSWRNSRDVSRYMYRDSYITEDEHMKWLEGLKAETNDKKVWIIYCGLRPIGVVDLVDMDFSNKTTNWGFYIGEVSYRGRGIGSITLFRLMEYVFDTIGFHRMYTSVLENNMGALQLYKRFGFREEGMWRKHILRDGKYVDVVWVGILKEEWENAKSSLPIAEFTNKSDEIE